MSDFKLRSSGYPLTRHSSIIKPRRKYWRKPGRVYMIYRQTASEPLAKGTVMTATLTGWSTPLARVRWVATWLLRSVAIVLILSALYVVSAVSPRVLIRFMPDDGSPPHHGPSFDPDATLGWCLGAGWIIALIVFSLALIAALILRRWPWPLRMLVVLSPMLLVLCAWLQGDLHAWLRPWAGTILAIETLLAALAAVLCRTLARAANKVFRHVPQHS